MNRPDPDPFRLPRRHLLGLGLAAAWQASPVRAAAVARADAVSAHFPFGPVSPRRPAPALKVRTHTGQTVELSGLLVGRVSAVQLMFTGCSATCPIQGALFSQAQSDLGRGLPVAQFVSLSIDPLADSPAALAAWLRRFDAAPGWLAAASRVEDLDRLLAWLGEGGQPRPEGRDPHNGQVYIIDLRGELAYRTISMPPPTYIVSALRNAAARG